MATENVTTTGVQSYDLVVIGGGPGGYVAAIRGAQLGMKVACIEKRKSSAAGAAAYGGTCLNVGCIPSKALLESSEHYLHTKTKLAKHGVLVDNIRLDLSALMKRKEAVVRQNVNGITGLFKKNKIEGILGTGKITAAKAGENLIEVEGGESGKRTLSAKNIIIATGSEPTNLSFMPFDGKRILSSTEALELNEVPKHLVVVGGGVIGLELGSVWLRLGARVTVIEYMDKILPPTDRQLANELYKILMKQGMEFKLATKCLGAKADAKGVVVQTEELATGTKSQLECDYVLVSTGRRPYTDGLGLKEIGVTMDKVGRVEIDPHFRTNIPGIYAIGDVVQGPMLAHKAEDEGVACAEIIAGQAGHVNYDAIPNVVYTWPELATVGLNEEELKAKNVSYKVGTFPFLANGRARTMEETDGLVKIISDAKTDRVLGVHILGPRASDLIPEAVSVMEFGGSAEDIARTCHAHPTLSETVKEAAMAVDKRQIHM